MNDVITIKIDSDKKDEYKKICKENDTTMAQDIRRYINSVIKIKK